MENPYQTPITQQNKDPAPVSLTTGVEFLLAVLATGLLSLTGLVIHWACQIAPYDAVLENQIWVVLFASTLALVSIPFARTRRLCLPVSNLICALAGIATLLYLGYSSAIAWYLGVPYEYYAYLNRALAEHLWIFQSIIAVLTLAPLLFLINRLRHSVYLSAFVQAFILTSAAFFLRVNFIMQYSDEFPTSWLQFFWPAVSSLP